MCRSAHSTSCCRIFEFVIIIWISEKAERHYVVWLVKLWWPIAKSSDYLNKQKEQRRPAFRCVNSASTISHKSLPWELKNDSGKMWSSLEICSPSPQQQQCVEGHDKMLRHVRIGSLAPHNNNDADDSSAHLLDKTPASPNCPKIGSNPPTHDPL